MIFYFSATGNSLYVAKSLSQMNNDNIMNIASIMNTNSNFEYSLKDDEAIGFVFPLFAWSAPKMIFDFINNVEFKNYNGNYIFAIATYGQNIGRFDKFIEKALNENNMNLNSAFSLNMPNNYIIIWNKEKQDECLLKANKRLDYISNIIKKRENIFDVKTVINGIESPEGTAEDTAISMNAWFNSTLSDVSQFYVTDDCIGCKLCSEVCNGQTLTYDNEKPVWGDKCTKCLACLHICPQRAIQFGEITETTGRYRNPNIKVNDLKLF